MITTQQAIAVIGPVDDETLLADLIAMNTATLGRLLGRYLGPPIERTEIRNGGRVGMRLVPWILLRETPTPGTTVTVRTRGGLFETWTALTNPDTSGNPVFVVDGRQVHHSSGWPAGPGTVEVTYTAGYDPGAGPEELQKILLQMVAEDWSSIGTEDLGPYKSRSLGDHSWTKWTPAEVAAAAGSLGIDWAALVNQWRPRLV